MNMGFSKQHAENALKIKRGNVEQAALWCAMNADPGKAERKAQPKQKKPTKGFASNTTVTSRASKGGSRKPSLVKQPSAEGRFARHIVDTPEKQRKRKAERKALEEEYEKRQEALKKDKTLKATRKVAQQSGTVDVKIRPEVDPVLAAVKKRQNTQKQQAAAKAMRAAKAADEKKQKELKLRNAKRHQAESKLQGIQDALDYLVSNYSVDRVRETLTLIVKVGKRILKDPKEPKFRRIKLSNQRVQRAIVRPLGAMYIMRKLGFEESEGGAVLVMSQPHTKSLQANLENIEKSLNRGATKLPERLREAESKGASPEFILFAATELRRILVAIAELPASVPLRSLETGKGSVYAERFAPKKPLLTALADLGFEEHQNGRYVRLTKPDVAVIREAIGDLDREIALRTSNTRVAKALRELLGKHGKAKAVHLVDKARACIGRIQRSPSEKRYWTVDLKRLFDANGTLEYSRDVFSGLGFTVKENIAQWGGSDLNGLGIALAHLDHVWKSALVGASGGK